MADLIVSPVIDVVMQRVVAYLEDRIELHWGVEEKLKKLEEVLNRILPKANTAEEVNLEKHKDLKPWMRNLKFAIEEAKDVVDEFEYLRLKRQVEEVRSSGSPSTGKRIASRILIPSCVYNYANKTMTPSTDLLKRLKGIQSKLEELDSIAIQFLQLADHRMATDREHQIQDVRKRETSSSVVERELVGRRKDMLEEIIIKLLQEEEEEHISVIAVVGHGGMGKTTLAQNIFNDTRVESHFQVRMWAHVSQVFDVSTLTKKIIESATRKESSDSSLETLQQKLKDVLKSKRFLLVLDDVWYSQLNGPFTMEEEWNKLCSPLSEACGKGSKILLTSRTPEVKELSTGALMPTMISLQGLAPDECWSIMQTSAFRGSGIPDGCRDLVEIGKQIALKVHGSPLAAKAMGGILRKELSLRHWSNIVNTEFLKLPGSDIIMAVLILSYKYLPPHLRQCFAYCSLFPEGHKFNVPMLIRMWVAHGYIQDRQGEMSEEDMGKSYFNDLLSAGFFTRQNFFEEEETVMHDLMNDLARFVTGEEILRIDKNTQYSPIPKTVRHLSVTTDYLLELSKNRSNLSFLESFLLFPCRARGGDSLYLDDKLVKELLQQLRRVRVLDLNHCKVKELPDDISQWVHLRYLDVSYTAIRRLPDSLMILYHLQVLTMGGHFKELPWEIRLLEKLNNLVNLRLLITGTSLNLSRIRDLKSLQVVPKLMCDKEWRGSEIKNLKALNDLREALWLNNLHYIESGAVAREAELYRKNQLQALGLTWGKDCSTGVGTEVLQALQPPKTLECLTVDSYPGIACPSWMSIPFLENLTSIKLSNLFHLECIPPLGQQLPFLQCINLKRLPRVRKLSLEGFASLKYLTIERMEELEEWSGPDGSGGLPCLENFCIAKCSKMRMLPALSHTVTELSIDDVGISTLPGLVLDQGIITNSGISSSSGITSFSSKLSNLEITNCGNLTSLGEGLLQNQQRLTNLISVAVRECKMLVSIPDGGFQELKSLTTLVIVDCPNLTWAAPAAAPRPREDVDRGLLPSSLEHLSISHIDDDSLSRCLQGLSRLSKQQANYLTSLQELSIYSCQALTPSALEEGLHALPSLKVLLIYDCPGLLVKTSSAIGVGPPCPLALEELEIDDPQMLVNVPVLKSLTSVRKVKIRHAPEAAFPYALSLCELESD